MLTMLIQISPLYIVQIYRVENSSSQFYFKLLLNCLICINERVLMWLGLPSLLSTYIFANILLSQLYIFKVSMTHHNQDVIQLRQSHFKLHKWLGLACSTHVSTLVDLNLVYSMCHHSIYSRDKERGRTQSKEKFPLFSTHYYTWTTEGGAQQLNFIMCP